MSSNLSRAVPTALTSVLLGAASAPAFAQQVWTVGPGPGEDFSSLQAAIDAAGEGDTLLVRSGVYAPFQLVAKSLVIHADSGADVEVSSVSTGISIRDLGPGQSARLSGFKVRGPAFGLGLDPMRVDDCAGQVWLQDFEIELGVGFIGRALGCFDAADVVLERCTLLGGAPLLPGAFGLDRTALELVNSSAVLHQCTVVGGDNLPPNPLNPSSGHPGARGLTALDSLVWVDGGELRGGNGSSPSGGVFTPCVGDGGAGGAGLYVAGASLVELHDVVLAGGAGGNVPANCVGQVGAPGATSTVVSGVLSTLPGTARTLALPATVREGDAYELEFTGVPQDLVWFGFGTAAESIALPLVTGPLLLGGETGLVFMGVLPGSGALDVPVLLGDIGQGPLTVFCQGVHFNFSEGFVLSSARAVLHLDGSQR